MQQLRGDVVNHHAVVGRDPRPRVYWHYAARICVLAPRIWQGSYLLCAEVVGRPEYDAGIPLGPSHHPLLPRALFCDGWPRVHAGATELADEAPRRLAELRYGHGLSAHPARALSVYVLDRAHYVTRDGPQL